MPDPKDVNDVLLALSLYEGADSECDNEIVDGEIGPDPATVDGVLDYLWEADQIEGIMVAGDRRPNLGRILRGLPDRGRLWGDEVKWRARS